MTFDNSSFARWVEGRTWRVVWWKDTTFGRPRFCRNFYGGGSTVFTCWRLWIEWGADGWG